MAFVWKDPKVIWKGVGIYHITFMVAGRRPLLGELVAEYPNVSRPFYRNLTNVYGNGVGGEPGLHLCVPE